MENCFWPGLYFKGLVENLNDQTCAWRPIRVPILFLSLALIVTLFTGCITSYYPYSGAGIYQGQGGASKMVDGIDIWVVGTPPRKFQIIGYVEDSRPAGPLAMAQRNHDLAAQARRNGGNAVILNADESQLVGVSSFANVNAFQSGNVATATGTGMAVPIRRREGRFYVIKYVQELPGLQGPPAIPSPKPF